MGDSGACVSLPLIFLLFSNIVDIVLIYVFDFLFIVH